MSPRPRPQISDDVSVKHRPRIEQAFIEVARAGLMGLTWKEFAKCHNLHHGQATPPLSRLHEMGTIERLVQKRNGCGIYVLSSLINGRPTEPFRSNSRIAPDRQAKRLLDSLEAEAMPFEAVLEGSKGFLAIRYRPVRPLVVGKDV